MWVKEDYAMEILTLGEKIKRRRKELEMTLKDLAGDRITPGQISLVESGKSNPSIDLLEYLVASLGTSIEYLMESEESQAEKICYYYENLAEAHSIKEEWDEAEKYIEESLHYSDKYKLDYRYLTHNKLDVVKKSSSFNIMDRFKMLDTLNINKKLKIKKEDLLGYVDKDIESILDDERWELGREK